VADLPIVLIIENDVSMQGIVEDALNEAGFETAIAPSAEDAVTLLKGKVMNYRAFVADINLRGRMTGWDVAKQPPTDRIGVSGRLHDGCRGGRLGLAWRAQQHIAREALFPCPTCHSCVPAFEYGHAEQLRG
jgi:hypothetical protein